MCKTFDLKRMQRILKRNGYFLARVTGGHFIYKNDKGNTIVVNKNIRNCVARRLVRENNLNLMI